MIDLDGVNWKAFRDCGGLPADYTSTLVNLHALERKLNELFVAKEELVRMIVISAIAQQPLLVLGPPGTAKSKIILKFCEGLGLRRACRAPADAPAHAQRRDTFFQYLLNGFTEPDEILGPVDIHALRATPPTYGRIREGSITEAAVVFLDEVFRGNSAILNAMLSIMNERQVYEAGGAHPANVRLFFGVANSVPGGRQLDELRAFYERFVIRVESDLVPTALVENRPSENRRRLLARGWSQEVAEIRAGRAPEGNQIDPFASLDDVLFLNRAAAELWGGDSLPEGEPSATPLGEFIDAYHRLVDVITKDNLASIDDRKFIRLFLLMRAQALYERNSVPRIKDLYLLSHTWNEPTQKAALESRIKGCIADR